MTNAKAKKVTVQAEVAKAATTTPELTVLFKEAELYKGEKAIFKALESAFTAAQDINKEYQKIALSCIEHSMLHGDITVISRLLDRFPEGMRKDSLSAYFDKYGCVDFKPQNQLDAKHPLFDAKSSKVVAIYSKSKRESMKKNGWYLQAATNWWFKAAKQTEYVPFNLDEYLIKVAGYLQKKAKQPKEGDIIDSVAIEQVVAAINQTVSKHKEQAVAQAAA